MHKNKIPIYYVSIGTIIVLYGLKFNYLMRPRFVLNLGNIFFAQIYRHKSD